MKPNHREIPKTNSVSDLAMSLGRLPPQHMEAEEAVLGAVMIEKDALTKVLHILTADCFYKEAHRILFEACLFNYEHGVPNDYLTVTTRLRTTTQLDFVGGAYYIVELGQRVSSSANIEHHARIIVECYTKREIIKMTSEITRRAFDYTEDVFDLAESLQAGVLACTQGLFKKKGKTLKDLIAPTIKEIEVAMAQKQKGEVSGIPTGYRQLDALTGGWQRSDLIILAGRPSSGKSAAAVNFAINAYKSMDGVGILFSMEMKATQIMKRILSTESGVKYSSMAKGEVSNSEFASIVNNSDTVSTENIIVDDSTYISVLEMKSKAANLKLEKGRLDFVIADYVQLAKALVKGNREQEVASISRGLKELAKELDVPVIALAQLSRKVEERSDKRPQMSDLRESGGLEQDADVVVFIHRPEYYGIMTDESGMSTVNLATLIFAKHRNGALIDIPLRCNLATSKFSNWGDEPISEIPDWKPNSFPVRDYTEPLSFGLESPDNPF